MPAVHGIRELVFADAGTRRGRRQWIRRKLLVRGPSAHDAACGAVTAERGGGACALKWSHQVTSGWR
jgi:hypothetical protein